MNPQNKQMHCRTSPKRSCNSYGSNTMKISSRYHRLLIYDVKRTTKIDGMGPFNFIYEKNLIAVRNVEELSLNKSSLVKHARIHTRERTFTCSYC